MKELAPRQDVNDLEEVVRRNAQRAHEPILNRPRHLAEPSFVVLSLEYVNLCDRHFPSPSRWLRQCLDDKRDALAAADAQRDNSPLEAVAAHRMDQAGRQDSARRPDRMAMCDGPTLDVDDILRQA